MMSNIPNQSLVAFRIYTNGEVLHEDNFRYRDLGIIKEFPYHTVFIPLLVVEHIEDTATGK